jgi:hypothetical protein
MRLLAGDPFMHQRCRGAMRIKAHNMSSAVWAQPLHRGFVKIHVEHVGAEQRPLAQPLRPHSENLDLANHIQIRVFGGTTFGTKS